MRRNGWEPSRDVGSPITFVCLHVLEHHLARQVLAPAALKSWASDIEWDTGDLLRCSPQVAQFAGGRERARWRRLRPLIAVVKVADSPGAAAVAPGGDAAAAQAAQPLGAEPGRSGADCHAQPQQDNANGAPAHLARGGLNGNIAGRGTQQQLPDQQHSAGQSTEARWCADWAVAALESSSKAGGSADGYGADRAPADTAAAAPGSADPPCSTSFGGPAAQAEGAVAARQHSGTRPQPLRSVHIGDSRLASVQRLTPEVRAVLAVGDAMQARLRPDLPAPTCVPSQWWRLAGDSDGPHFPAPWSFEFLACAGDHAHGQRTGGGGGGCRWCVAGVAHAPGSLADRAVEPGIAAALASFCRIA